MASSGEDEEKLKLECQELRTELEGLKSQLQDLHLQAEPVNKDVALGDIFLKKKQTLEAHLKVLKETDLDLSNLSETTQVNLLLENMERSVGELDETLLLVTKQQEQCEREATFLRTRVIQEEKLRDAVQQKVAELGGVEQENEGDVLRQLEKDCGATETRRKQLIKDMKTFVNEHFPAHGDHSLIDTLQLLMNRCVESPHAPYIECDGIWPPYLEMLLVTGIAILHKDNDKLIRLNPFHR